MRHCVGYAPRFHSQTVPNTELCFTWSRFKSIMSEQKGIRELLDHNDAFAGVFHDLF